MGLLLNDKISSSLIEGEGILERNKVEAHYIRAAVPLPSGAGECCRASTYIGRHKKHPNNVELILDVATDDGVARVLVAVVLRPNRRGNYAIDSTYCICGEEIDQRLTRGFVKKIR